MTLSRAEILAIKVKTATVDVDGGAIKVRELTAAENEAYAKGMLNAAGEADLNVARDLDVALVIMGAIDDEGSQLFSTEDIDDIRALPHTVTRAIADGVREVTGIKKKPEPDSTTNGASYSGSRSR